MLEIMRLLLVIGMKIKHLCLFLAENTLICVK